MDIQAKVAARRGELSRQAREAALQEAAKASFAKAEEERRHNEALDRIATELSGSDVDVVRVDRALQIKPAPPAPLDTSSLKDAQLEALLEFESRKLWTPDENWRAISLITGGISFLLGTFMAVFTVAALGPTAFMVVIVAAILCIIVGASYHARLTDRYRAKVIGDYPGVFSSKLEKTP